MHRFIRNHAFAIAVTSVLCAGLGACAHGGKGAQSISAAPQYDSVRAQIARANGSIFGEALLTETESGLKLSLSLSGLPQGAHGLHIHTVGRCDAPDFASAGAHWNPTGAQHGRKNPAGAHAGDLPNLLIGTDGKGALGIDLPGATLRGVMDADGSAIVIHAMADDLMTDPSGNSGARIGCGVFIAPG